MSRQTVGVDAARRPADGAATMGLSTPQPLRAIVFDYGNTLIEFSRRHVEHCDAVLGGALERAFGPFDPRRFDALREEHRLGPYRNGFREQTIEELTRQMVVALYARVPSPEALEAIVAARFAAFVEVVEVESATLAVLSALGRRFRLGLLSNYPCGRSIRASLDRVGLSPLLNGVVVSGDIGVAKPHPSAFAAIGANLGAAPAATLFVGDNWLADVQGARRAGMTMVRMERWTPPEHFDPALGDLEPDATIQRIDELLSLV